MATPQNTGAPPLTPAQEALLRARRDLARSAATYAAAMLVGQPPDQERAGRMLEAAAEALVAAKREASGAIVVVGGSVPS